MPENKRASIRYRVIDECLRNPERVYHWQDLAEACYEELSKDFDNYTAPSERTIKGDIAFMRNDKIGYNAPIDHTKEDGYRYSDSSFSIYNVKLKKEQIHNIKQAFNILKQLTNNVQFDNIHDSILLVEQKLQASNLDEELPQYIFFEETTNRRGLRWLDPLYKLIKDEKACRIKTTSFDDKIFTGVYSPYFIKEYNNRFYVIAYCHETHKIHNVGLDRIDEIHESIQPFAIKHIIDHKIFYKDIIGVTHNDVPVVKINIKIDNTSSDYLLTKPIHDSQKLIKFDENEYAYISFELKTNYEFYSKILAYGSAIEILEPQEVRDEVKRISTELFKLYH